MFKPSIRREVVASSSNHEVKIGGRRGAKSAPTEPSAEYPYRLNFYTRTPKLDITLDEFETFALERLKVLSHIEQLSHRGLPPAQHSQALGLYLKSHLPLASNTARHANWDEERRPDQLGHWVLRLAFCRSPDLRQRFVKAETALFRYRFEMDDKHERAEFLRSLDFDWGVVETDELTLYAEQLAKCMPWSTSNFAGKEKDQGDARTKNQSPVMSESWFKVPWYNVPDLVGSRRVFVNKGYAYVPQTLQISLVLQAFSSRLAAALELTAKNLPRLDEDDRLAPVVEHLASSFLAGVTSDYEPAEGDAVEGRVTADMVVDLAKRHFPACSRNLFDRLQRDHHLKHFGRLQLNLFLKGVGLPLEEAIAFWRKGFGVGSHMTDDKFNKEYKYNIRHNYGQEGKRENYRPKSCQQILTQNQPGTQDSHGCPFRHFGAENLPTFLSSVYPQITRNSTEMKEILDSVKGSHYHLACTRVFEITHNVKKGEGLGQAEAVSHPNKYYDRSVLLEKEAREAKESRAEGDAMDMD